jgi:hypothetical protein
MLVDQVLHFDSLGDSLKDSRVRVEGMHERTNIQLSRADRSKLEAVVANRNSPQKHAWRARVVLLTADGRGTAEIMQATGKAKTVIWRWQERSATKEPLAFGGTRHGDRAFHR